jgi:hypothetical protein
MLQNHISPLFYRPLTFFGSYHTVEDELNGEELDLADLWRVALEKELLFSLQSKTEIFIHWCDTHTNECDSEFSVEP